MIVCDVSTHMVQWLKAKVKNFCTFLKMSYWLTKLRKNRLMAVKLRNDAISNLSNMEEDLKRLRIIIGCRCNAQCGEVCGHDSNGDLLLNEERHLKTAEVSVQTMRTINVEKGIATYLLNCLVHDHGVKQGHRKELGQRNTPSKWNMMKIFTSVDNVHNEGLANVTYSKTKFGLLRQIRHLL